MPDELAKSERVDDFLRLLSGCERRLYAYTLSLVSGFHDADDIAQETRLRLWQQFDQFESSSVSQRERDFEAWARTIAYYQVLTHREKKGRQQRMFKQSVVELLAKEYAERSEGFAERERALLSCIESVDESSRNLLQLVYADGVPIKEAATHLNRSTAGTYKTLERLRQRLQTCIEKTLAREAK